MLTKNKKGFTLIEVVLVLAIAGLIFLVVFLALPALQRSQRDQQRRQDMAKFMSQVTTYSTNNQGNVPEDDTGSKGVNAFVSRYLAVSGEQFNDPSSGSPYKVEDKTGSLSDKPGVGGIFYFRGATCEGESVISEAGNRNVAIITQMEGGSYFCQNN